MCSERFSRLCNRFVSSFHDAFVLTWGCGDQLRFHYYHCVDTSAVELLVKQNIIHQLFRVSGLCNIPIIGIHSS